MQRLNREESRNRTRDTLRKSALREFARHGFGGASVDRIAEQAGFSRGAFYSNYATKQDLFLDLAKEHVVNEAKAWQRLVNDDLDIEQIFGFMTQRGARFAEQRDWGLILVELELQAVRDTTFAAQYQQYHDDLYAVTKRMLEDLFAVAGKLVPGDIHSLTMAVLSLTLGLTLHSRPGPRAVDPEATSAMFVLFLRGLLSLAEPATSPKAPKGFRNSRVAVKKKPGSAG